MTVRPYSAAIRVIVTKFRTKFTLLNITPLTRLRIVRTENSNAAVSASVNDDHQLSFRCRSQELGLGLCYSTKWKILRKDLVVKPFKIQLMQELKRYNLLQRRIYGEWGLGKWAKNPLLYRKIVFSDGGYFWLNGYINKQNCRFWSED